MSIVLFSAEAFWTSAHHPVFCPVINCVSSSNYCLRFHVPKYRGTSKRKSFYDRDIKYQSYRFCGLRTILFSFPVNSGEAFLGSVGGDEDVYSSESEALETDDELLAARTSLSEAHVQQEATLKEKDELLLKLAQSDIRQQEYVSAIIHDKELAVSELNDAKSIFNQNLQKAVEEKFTLESKLDLAKQDAIELAVQVEKLAENAFQKATSRILEEAQLRILEAETSASDASFKMEDRIRNATEGAILPIVEQSKRAIEKALTVAESAGDTTMKAVETIIDGTNQVNEIVSIQSQNLKLQNSVHGLESEILFTRSELEGLKLELEKAHAIANSSEIRANAAERHLIEFQESSKEKSLQHKEEIKSLLEKMKNDAADRMRSISKAFKVELEGIKSAIEASKRTEHFKDAAYVRRCEALQRSLKAAEDASKMWKHRAEVAESLILKESSVEGYQDSIFVVNGGRINLWSEDGSQKWKFLSEGPRREIPDWMAQKIWTMRPKFEPRRNDISEASLLKFKTLDLPKLENVWSIAGGKQKEEDTLIKHVIEKDILDKPKDLEPAQRKPIQWQKTSDPTKLAPGTGSGKEIVFQGFHWESWRRKWYLELASKAADLSKSGITAVWFPPPTESVAPQGYMPSDLYNLNSAYGSEDELKHCVEEMHNHNLLALGDTVLNHRCAHKQSSNGVWNIFGGKLAWGPKAIVCDDPNYQGEGNPSSGDHFHAAPNIDHSQQFVRNDIKQWLNWLRNDIGFDGWRLDFARGFSGSYVKEYIEASHPAFCIGEYWDSLSYEGGNLCYNQDAHRQRIVNWINATGGTSSAFDVTTKGILHAALHNQYWRLIDPNGKPTGVMGWWPSRAVTFLENHDTGSTQGHWPFPRDKLSQGYAYILTHPGTPVIFYEHFYDFGIRDVITELIEARGRGGVHCRSNVKIYHANNEGYVAGVGDRLVMKIGGLDWNPSKENHLEGSWHKFLNKHSDYQVWLRQ